MVGCSTGQVPAHSFHTRRVVITSVAVNGYECAVLQLEGVTKATATAAVIDVTDDDSVLVEVPRLPIVGTNDGSEPGFMAVGRVAAYCEGQHQPTIVQR